VPIKANLLSSSSILVSILVKCSPCIVRQWQHQWKPLKIDWIKLTKSET
jgi:hypothetical protein